MQKILQYFSFLLFFGFCFWAPLFAENMTLSQAIDQALGHNLSLQAEQLKIEKAQIQIQTALASAIPNLKLDVSQSKLDSYSTRLATKSSVLVDYSSLKLSSTLVLGFHTLPVIQNSQLALQIAEYDYEAKRQSTIYQVMQAYYGVLKAQKASQLSEENLNLVTSLLNQTQNYYRVGFLTKSAVLQMEVRLKETQGKLLDAKKMVKLSTINLNLLLGYTLEQGVSLDAAIPAETIPTSDKTSLLNLALNRSDVMSLTKTRDLLKAVVPVTQAAGLPNFVLLGQYGYIGTDQFTFDHDNRDWLVAGSVSWTLFDGLSTDGKVKEARNNLEQMERTLDLTKERICLEVTEALLSLESASASLETAQLGYQSATEFLDLTREQFNTGAITYQDVLNAQLAYQQAQTGLLSAQFDLLLAKAKLKYVSGTL